MKMQASAGLAKIFLLKQSSRIPGYAHMLLTLRGPAVKALPLNASQLSSTDPWCPLRIVTSPETRSARCLA